MEGKNTFPSFDLFFFFLPSAGKLDALKAARSEARLQSGGAREKSSSK